VPTLTTVSLAC